jgi:DNA-binding GntR family transcriptional regulator
VAPHDLDLDELRELHPAELMLECAGVRHAPRYDRAALAELRAANAQLGAAAGDAAAAVRADEDFHRRLAARAEHARLHAALGPLRRRLAPYRRLLLADAGRVARSTAEHEAIVAALERGDRRAAELRLRAHGMRALAEVSEALERRSDREPADAAAPGTGRPAPDRSERFFAQIPF